MFSVHKIKKQKPAFSNTPSFQERFQKASFSWRISVDGGLTVETKLRLQISPRRVDAC